MMGICPWVERDVRPPAKQRPTSDGPSVIDAFNAAHDIRRLLIQYGYKQTGKDRFLSPNSATKLAIYLKASGMRPRAIRDRLGLNYQQLWNAQNQACSDIWEKISQLSQLGG
jgi:type I site-specific restriction endonuclease